MGDAMEDVRLELSALRRQLEAMSEAQAATRLTVEDIHRTVAPPGARAPAAQPDSVVEVPCPETPASCGRPLVQPGAPAPTIRSRSPWWSEPLMGLWRPPPVAVAPPDGAATTAEPDNVVEVPCTETPTSFRPSPLTPASAKRSRSWLGSEPSRVPSRMSCGPSEDEKLDVVVRIINTTEEEGEAPRTFRFQGLSDATLDSAMAVVIVANSIYVAANMDMSDGSALWVGLDVFFSATFLAELSFKLKSHGFRKQFCGDQRFSNMFDTMLVLVDVLQLLLLFILGAEGSPEGAPPASLFRLVRIIKLGRILRILKADFFSDLVCMIHGMAGGLSTLMWSLVFFVLLLYVVSLVFREAFGRIETDVVYMFFDSVPRSMLTTFRCSFGDCSTFQGTPLFEHIQLEVGTEASIACCAILFLVTVGLFNVISAIFVQSTMLAAAEMDQDKRVSRLLDQQLWSTRIYVLMHKLMAMSPQHEAPDRLSDQLEDVLGLEVPAKTVDMLLRDPEAIAALDDLDISRADHPFLADILDPDNSGSITIHEFVDGLRRLRGQARRSDIVSVDLMVRCIQRQVFEMHGRVISAESNRALSLREVTL